MSDSDGSVSDTTFRQRPALYSDNSALLQLVSSATVSAGEHVITFDRSPNVFAQLELQTNGVSIVVEDDKSLLGCGFFSVYKAMVADTPTTVAHKYLGRVSPSTQRRGIGEVVMRAREREEVARGAQLWYAFNDLGNAAIQRLHSRTLDGRAQNFSLEEFEARPASQLPHVTYNILAAGAAVKCDSRVRQCRLSDLDTAANLFNETHAGYDLFVPLTGHLLATRMTRSESYSPRLYFGFEDHGRLVAVAGLWLMGRDIRERWEHKHSGEVILQKRAAVVDWGYARGCESHMATLVRSLVGLAAQEDYQEVMFAEESSVVAPELDEPIRYRSESMLFYCRALTLDEDVALPQLPIYLDPVYF